MLALTSAGMILAYVGLAIVGWAGWTIDGDTVRWIGVILCATGGALRLWPVFALDHRFSGWSR
jgi:hypothetical protein